MVYKLLPVLVLVLALSCVGASAQPEDGDNAHVIVLNLLADDEGDAPAIDVWFDDELFAQDTPPFSGVIERVIVAGDYVITVTAGGADTDAPLFEPIQATLEAGNIYMIFAAGFLPIGTGNASLDLIHLGQPLPPGETSPGRIVVANLMEGLPAVDLALDGEVIASGVPLNESVISEAAISEFVRESWSDTQTGEAILEQGPPEGEEAPPYPIIENSLTIFILHGEYPGEPHEDYGSWLLPPIHIGEITIIDGSDISVGEEVAVELEPNQRIRFTLTLDEPTVVDILLLGASPDQDAFLRLYDAEGNLLHENDELSYEDDVYDAGITGLALEAGTYLIEAASWGEHFAGSFTLSVVASQEANGD